MKLLITFLLASTFSTSVLWLTDFEAARSQASQKHKHILINFSGSDWCGPCIRMHKEIFESGAFDKYAADNLVLVQADFPRLAKHQLSSQQTRLNEALADKYNPSGKFPYTILLDEKGNILKSWEGYSSTTPSKFIDDVNSVVHASL